MNNISEVNFSIDLDLSLCELNDKIEKLNHHQNNQILIIQLSNNCSLIQQLSVLKNISWIQDYIGIIFSVNHNNVKFEDTLLSYLYHQIESSLNHSKLSNFSFYTTSSDYGLNQTMIGFINSNEINRLNQQNAFLYRLNPENFSFDSSIFLIVSILLFCMLIGNEWHRRIFLEKLQNHYSSSKTTRYQIGFLLGLLIFICFVIIYLLDRFLTNLIGEIYLFCFLIFSPLFIFLCLDYLSFLLIKQFELNNSKQIHQYFRLILTYISFLMIILWVLNRFSYVGLFLTNAIVLSTTIVIISQMRIVNLMIIIIIFIFIFLFEFFMLIIKIYFNQDKNILNLMNSKFTIGIQRTGNEDKNLIFISQLYMDIFENSGSNWILNGGSMNILKLNAIKWIIQENLPLVFSFPRFSKSKDSCGFYVGKIYLSIDDLIFPSLLINFCRLFDIGNNIHYRIYYIQVLIMYMISFIISYLIMIFTKHDQLSSIIIYPMIIISTIITGLIRREFRMLLTGTLTQFKECQKQERENSF